MTLINSTTTILAIHIKESNEKNIAHTLEFFDIENMLHTINITAEHRSSDSFVNHNLVMSKKIDNKKEIAKYITWNNIYIGERLIRYRENGKAIC